MITTGQLRTWEGKSTMTEHELYRVIDDRITNLQFKGNPYNLYQPISYTLSLGGKRLRPVLTLLGNQLFDDSLEKALDPAVGVEVFHNFTLLHDDIMDKAPLRRGEPTVHRKWNPDIAILSGDVMLVEAYQLITSVDDNILRETLMAFNDCARGVCEGQQMDMDFESAASVSEEEYLEMIRLKTAVLLGFSLELGAMVGGAANRDRNLIREFGECLGIGFQLKDDLLDVYGDHNKFGKQVGGDIISNKKTFLWIEAMLLANEKTRRSLDEWLGAQEFDPREKVRAVTEIFDSLSIRERTLAQIEKYFSKAFNILDQIDAPREKKDGLTKFANQLINRDR